MNNMTLTEEEKRLMDVRVYPIRPHIGVGCIIQYNNQILLIQRKYDPEAGKWSIPGGHLELGESPEEGAAREAKEEVGIDVKIEKLSGVVNKILKDNEGQIKYHYVLINFFAVPVITADKKEPMIYPSEECLDARFVSISELGNYDLTKSLRDHFIDLGLMKGP